MSDLHLVCCKQPLASFFFSFFAGSVRTQSPAGLNMDSLNLTADLFPKFPGAPLLCISKLPPLDFYIAAGNSFGLAAESAGLWIILNDKKTRVLQTSFALSSPQWPCFCGYIEDVSHLFSAATACFQYLHYTVRLYCSYCDIIGAGLTSSFRKTLGLQLCRIILLFHRPVELICKCKSSRWGKTVQEGGKHLAGNSIITIHDPK